jgi:hypothetical protein
VNPPTAIGLVDESKTGSPRCCARNAERSRRDRLLPGQIVQDLEAARILAVARTEEEHAPVDQCSFRDQLAFSIGFVVSSNHVLLRRMLKEHTSDDARAQLAELVIRHLELSGFAIDEEHQVLRKRPPTPNHG